MAESIPEFDLLPRHIGIIMDGNGRWAKKRGLPRTMGHRQGAKVFKRIVDDCIDIGLQCVTFYAFSTENWSRPSDEVLSIMKLFEQYLDDIRTMAQKNLRLKFLGDLTKLSPVIQKKIADAEEESRKNTGMICCVAVNYGGRDEILHAAKKLAMDFKNGSADLDETDEAAFSSYLYTAGLPDVDLVIRPSGEMRTSNFLIWQAAYAELVVMDVLWPDFKRKNLVEALNLYAGRNRRFGGI